MPIVTLTVTASLLLTQAQPAPAPPEATPQAPEGERSSTPPAPTAADRALPHLQAAGAAIREGDITAARAALQEALQADPESLDALLTLALLAIREGNAEEAVTHLQKVLALDPYNDDARVDLARAQWIAGNPEAARSTLDEVFTRHPTLPTALALQAQIETGEAPTASPWQPLIRAGVSVNYDSNVTLQNGALANATELEAATFQFDAIAGVTYSKNNRRPFSAFGVFSLQTAFAGDPSPAANDQIAYLNESIPSMAGVVATGRLPLGPVQGVIDVRYYEIFTAVFGNPLQSSVFPSLGVSYDFTPQHRLRVMAAGEIFAPHKLDTLPGTGGTGPDPSVNGAVGGNARYHGQLGIVSLVAQVDAKHNLNTENDIFTANTGFTEVGGTVYAEVTPVEGLALFGSVTSKVRLFEPDAEVLLNGAVVSPTRSSFTESVVATNVGARYTIGYFELFAAYAFTGRFGDLQDREYNRHQVTGGTRFWFP